MLIKRQFFISAIEKIDILKRSIKTSNNINTFYENKLDLFKDNMFIIENLVKLDDAESKNNTIVSFEEKFKQLSNIQSFIGNPTTKKERDSIINEIDIQFSLLEPHYPELFSE
jgi:phage-related tail protein